MHEVTKATAITFAVLILATTGFPEVGHRGEFRIQRTSWLMEVKRIPGSESQDNISTHLHTTDHSNCPQLPAPRSPTHTERKHYQLNGHRRCRKPNGGEVPSNGLRMVTHM
jgi:hypothetical protein